MISVFSKVRYPSPLVSLSCIPDTREFVCVYRLSCSVAQMLGMSLTHFLSSRSLLFHRFMTHFTPGFCFARVFDFIRCLPFDMHFSESSSYSLQRIVSSDQCLKLVFSFFFMFMAWLPKSLALIIYIHIDAFQFLGDIYESAWPSGCWCPGCTE